MTPVWRTDVSLQHFAGLVVSRERTPAFRVTVGCELQRPVTLSSHPLESNQNLSVFSRARNRVRQSGSTSAVHVLGRHGHDAQIITIDIHLSQSAAIPFREDLESDPQSEEMPKMERPPWFPRAALHESRGYVITVQGPPRRGRYPGYQADR